MDKPINKANLFNTALPAAASNILAADISPLYDPGMLRIYACMSVSGVISISRTSGGVTVTEALNAGIALTAGAAYIFSVPWLAGETINLVYSVTGGTINKLQIDESWS